MPALSQLGSLANHPQEGMVRNLTPDQMLAPMKRMLVCLSTNERSLVPRGRLLSLQMRTPYEQVPARRVSPP